MADLNIPNVNKKSDKYIFKKKLPLRRKSKRRLFTESVFMLILSLLLVYINYLIPNKSSLLQNIPSELSKLSVLIIDFSSIFLQILLIVFIFTSLIISLFLLIGSFYRILKIFSRKTKKISYK